LRPYSIGPPLPCGYGFGLNGTDEVVHPHKNVDNRKAYTQYGAYGFLQNKLLQ
jgi:hypothetical protein